MAGACHLYFLVMKFYMVKNKFFFVFWGVFLGEVDLLTAQYD